jgi:FMN phosphatase YigB (HAD superfamily)
VLSSADVVFLLDVDNTLLDNDRFAADLGDRLELLFGAAERARYWDLFGRRREQLGLADYLGALQDFRAGLDDRAELLGMSEFLLEYPFASRLFPSALEAVAHLRTLGRPAVLSDGDVVFQPRKIQRSGIWAAVEGRVSIYLHKEKVMDHVVKRFPAKHYVMVDDKARLLAAMKTLLGSGVTTVFVRQGHYAFAPESVSAAPAPDVTIEHIEELITHSLSDFEVRP